MSNQIEYKRWKDLKLRYFIFFKYFVGNKIQNPTFAVPNRKWSVRLGVRTRPFHG